MCALLRQEEHIARLEGALDRDRRILDFDRASRQSSKVTFVTPKYVSPMSGVRRTITKQSDSHRRWNLIVNVGQDNYGEWAVVQLRVKARNRAAYAARVFKCAQVNFRLAKVGFLNR